MKATGARLQSTGETMNALAGGIDEIINGERKPGKKQKYGFALLVFEFDQIESGRMNWVSNADRKDMIVALKEMVAQLEGLAGTAGRHSRDELPN